MDCQIAALAERQHGLVTRGQLVGAGITQPAIRHRLARGRLFPVHRGVYALGHRILTTDGIRIAATLAAGNGAVLSHRSAAALWEVRPSGILEVTLDRSRRPLRGIRLHQLGLPADEVTALRAIPVTTLARTLFDLAAVLPLRQVERAVNEAEVQRRLDTLSLADLVERHPGRRGISKIRTILARLRIGANLTRSELEARFLGFSRESELPLPEVNASLLVAGGWIECDFLWRDRRVIVELDGWAAHGTATAFERDRARDRMLSAGGWRLVRITWRQLHEDTDAIASDLRTILDCQPPSSSARAA